MVLVVFRDMYPISLLTETVGPPLLRFIGTASETLGGLTADLSNLPFIGGLFTVGATACIGIVRSYVGRVKQGATQEIQGLQSQMIGLGNARAKAEVEVTKLQQQLSGLTVEKQDVEGELLRLKNELLDVRDHVDHKDRYIMQLEAEKAEAYRFLAEFKRLQEQGLIRRVE